MLLQYIFLPPSCEIWCLSLQGSRYQSQDQARRLVQSVGPAQKWFWGQWWCSAWTSQQCHRRLLCWQTEVVLKFYSPLLSEVVDSLSLLSVKCYFLQSNLQVLLVSFFHFLTYDTCPQNLSFSSFILYSLSNQIYTAFICTDGMRWPVLSWVKLNFRLLYAN